MGNDEFDECIAELEKLRSTYLQTEVKCDDEVAKQVSDLGRRQHQSFQTVRDFAATFLQDSSINEHLRNENSSISLPGRDSVQNLAEASKTAVRIFAEMAKVRECESLHVKELQEQIKSDLDGFRYNDLNNSEFNQKFERVVRHFESNNGTNEEGNVSNSNTKVDDESSELSINTIISDDVMASSPI